MNFLKINNLYLRRTVQMCNVSISAQLTICFVLKDISVLIQRKWNYFNSVAGRIVTAFPTFLSGYFFP